MKINLKLTALIAATFILTSQCASEPKKTEDISSKQLDELIFTWSRSFAEVMHLVAQKHYKVTDFDQCMIKALDNFLTCLDPHSNLLDPKIYKHMMEATTGEFFGIGIIIDNTRSSKDKFLTIVDTIPDGPADKAGLKPFDKIVEIEDTSLEGMTTDEATSKLKGERNTKVHLKVIREGHTEMLSFDIMRDVIKEQNSLCFYLKNQNIYYLSLSMFSENSARQLEQLLQKIQHKKVKALILDLRNNSGGLLTSAVDIAGLFIEKGSTVVITKDKHGTVTEEYKTTRDPIAHNATPIFTLINNFTASAAEILAGCLKINAESQGKDSKGNKLIFLVGSPTFGKGSVQEVIPISNNCAIKITTSLYFLPNNTTVQGEGIAPDFEVERRMPPTESQLWFTKNYGHEHALPHYIKAKKEDEKEKKLKEAEEKKKQKEHKTWAERAQQMLETDNQLRETIHLINLLHKVQSVCGQKLSTRTDALDFLQSIYIGSKKLEFEEVKMIDPKTS